MKGRATVRFALVALVALAAASCAPDVHEPLSDAAPVAAVEPAPPPAPEPVLPPATLETARELQTPSSDSGTLVDLRESDRAAVERPLEASVQAVTQHEVAANGQPAAVEPVLVSATDRAPAVSRTTTAALDFDSLAKRLRKTKAMKLAAKLAFKGQSNALLDGFRAYHRRDGTTTLADLRQAYDRLFGELHASLRDRDPPLDRDVAASRAALWEMLADPATFTSELMAGS